VVAAAATTPSESVLELRTGTPRTGGARPGVDHWLCRMCGHQWDVAAGIDDASEVVTEGNGSAWSNPAAELRGAREQHGRTLTEVAVGTKIAERHLRALERDAPLEEFPSPAYARFFLREYAEYLRLDPDPLLKEFEARHAPVEEAPAPAPAKPVVRRAARTGWGVLAALSLVAIVAIALLPSFLREGEERTAAPALPEASPSPARDSGREPVTVTPAPEPNGIRAVLQLTEFSWVRAVADGETVEAATLEPGTKVVFRARDLLQLTLGNAGGVRLRVSGELVETGGSGDVVTLELARRDGEVVVVPG
jgi:hypothetical protein